jgi:hypothetical protein
MKNPSIKITSVTNTWRFLYHQGYFYGDSYIHIDIIHLCNIYIYARTIRCNGPDVFKTTSCKGHDVFKTTFWNGHDEHCV